MSFLAAWIPTFLMGFILAIAGFVLIARERRIERREAQEHEAKARSSK